MFAALAGLSVAPLRAQEDDAGGAGISRQMRVAIRFYEQGDDMSAMDRFMEILTKGAPSERAMANEYINLITHRMNTGGGIGGSPSPTGSASPAGTPGAAKPRPEELPPGAKGAPAPQAAFPGGAPGAAPGTPPPSNGGAAQPASAARPAPAPPLPAQGETITEGQAAPSRRDRAESVDEDARPRRSRERSRSSGEMPAANKTLMRKEIRARLRNAVERSVADLKSIEGVRVVMRDNGDPEAIGIPSSLLFQPGIAFQRDAATILDPLTKLVFALGTAQAVILPEGTAIGDAKVLDMRRTMGISSHLFNAGVAPPRVRVNLLNTQVDLPKGLLDFRGIVLVFVYNQPMNLVVESAVGDEQGPPISLGVFPQSFRPSRGQGVIIEFSVSDPPAGLVSWKFQLLQPSRDGSELAPLQDVIGGGPVFHQIFWNGRQNYFGDPLPPGRYECVLTARDAKNRQRSLHRWIQVIDDNAGAERLLAEGETGEAGPDSAGEPRSAAQPRSQGAAGARQAPEAAPAIVTERVSAPSADLAPAEEKPLVQGVAPAAPPAPAPVASAPKRPAAVQIRPGGSGSRRVVKRPVRKPQAPPKKKIAKAAEPEAADAAPAPKDPPTGMGGPESPVLGGAPAGTAGGAAIGGDAAAPKAEAPAPKTAEAAPKASAPAKETPGAWELQFNRDTYQLTPSSENLLAKVAAAVPDHPLENLRITGHAAPEEASGGSLAGQRAKMVAGLLVNRYQVDSKRISMSPAGAAGSKVELRFARVE